jgi:hypothetical protein
VAGKASRKEPRTKQVAARVLRGYVIKKAAFQKESQ